MNQRQKLGVPLGGGIDQNTHEWLVRPPMAAQVQNFDLDSGGAYTKRQGFSTVVQLDDSTGTILLPQPSALGVLGPSGLSVLRDDELAGQEYGAALPTAVTSHPVYSFRGAVSGAQVAYNGGYVGLVLTEADEESGRNAVVAVVDATTWTISAGPYYLPEIAHGARVEPIGDSSFMFLGVTISSAVRTTSAISGDLYGAVLAPGGAKPTPSLLNSLEADNAHDFNVLYDSHGVAGQSHVYISYIQGGNLRVAKVNSSLTSTPSTVVEPGPAPPVTISGCNHTVWYDTATDTVLVYETNSRSIWANDSTFSAWHSYPVGPLRGRDLPMFHLRADNGVDKLWLNDRKVMLFGSAPAGPVLLAGDRMTPTLHRRPQPRSTNGAFFFHRYSASEVENYGDRLVAGAEQITANEATTLVSGFPGRFERHVVPLAQGRLDLWRMDHFHAYYWYNNPETDRVLYGVTGQSAKNGTTLYVPLLVANSAYMAPPLQRAYDLRLRVPALSGTPTDSSISGGDFTSSDEANFGRSIIESGGEYLRTNDIAHRTGGSNVNEGVSQLVVAEVDIEPTEFSAIDLFGSVLVAAGGLSVFDGSVSLPAVLETPVLVQIGSDSGQDNIYQTSGVWSETTPTTDAVRGFVVDANQSVSFRGVLFTIDRNGVKYRSDSFTMGFIENNTGTSVNYFPKWTITLDQSHKNLIFGGRKLGVEIYASEEYEVAAPPSDEPSSHTFVMRTAVQYDPSADRFFVNGAALFNVDADETPFSIHTFNPTALYTESELGPEMPPASNVLAHAGNYLFLLSSEDPWLVWHSKPISASIGPEFHSTLTLRMPTESGGCVSLAGEADRILFLCKNGVYELFVAGSGPDANGEGIFPSLRRVYAGDGCINHACTVSGPFGTFFVSSSGPKIVARNGEIVDVGEALDVAADKFTHATFDPIEKEIWVSRGDDAYVLDTSSMAWTYSSLPSLASTVWNRTFYRVDDKGKLKKRASAAVQDGGTSYSAKYVSPWLTVEGQMGFARVRKVGVLTQILTNGNGKLRISLAYDYVDTNVDSFTYDFTSLGALAKPAQVWVRPTRQKLDALRVTVEDITE